jgi:hypothetical protein
MSTCESQAVLGHVVTAAPGHVANVQEHAINALTPDQVHQLADITDAILGRLDPDGTIAATYHSYEADPPEGR